MTDLAQSLAVTVAEIGHVRAALPALLEVGADPEPGQAG